MNLAKITANGQIIIPMEIRRKLNLKSGDKILFSQKQNGEIVISNASTVAIKKAQDTFSEAAEDMGLFNEDDVQSLVNETRCYYGEY